MDIIYAKALGNRTLFLYDRDNNIDIRVVRVLYNHLYYIEVI